MLGVMSTQEAMRMAQERGFDLVEINPKAEPPVCKILDFGKYKYEEKKRNAEAKRKQTVVDIKEVKVRPKTDDHDLETKIRAVRKFLEAGHKVKFTARFRGREITHPQVAPSQLDHILSNLDELSAVEVRPTMEQRTMMLIIAPKPALMQKVQQARAAAAKALRTNRDADRELQKRDEEIQKLEDKLAEDDDDDDDDDDDASEDDGKGTTEGA